MLKAGVRFDAECGQEWHRGRFESMVRAFIRSRHHTAVCLRRQPAAPLVSGHTMKSMTEEPRKPPRFFTIEQVAEELSVGVPLVRGMLRTGELRGIQVGGRGVWRIGIVTLSPTLSRPTAGRQRRLPAGISMMTKRPRTGRLSRLLPSAPCRVCRRWTGAVAPVQASVKEVELSAARAG
jgi:excisionase family DNA binding protein